MLVRQAMTPDPLTVPPDATLQDALELMLRFDIRELPVADDSGGLVGIITDRDVKTQLGPAGRDIDEGLIDDAVLEGLVEEVMSRDVETVFDHTEMSTACRMLVELRIGALPVVEVGGALVGILSVTDCLEQAANLFERLDA